jgi:arylsulfatase A-like enzyme
VGGVQEPLSLVEQRLVNKADRITPQILRKLRRHYYGQITHVDYQLGLLLGELKRQGLYDNTAVVITSDHGEHLGDHHLFAKYTFLESAAHIPLILKPPTGMAVPGQRIETPTLTADIAPTLLTMAGLTPSEQVGGKSLLDLPPERIIFGETRSSAFATDGRLKYIYYLDGGVEHLFDVVTDPDDLHNLAQETAVAGEKKRLKQALQAYLAQHARPVLDENGEFVVVTRQLDETTLRAENMSAWRGPLRYGQGYG